MLILAQYLKISLVAKKQKISRFSKILIKKQRKKFYQAHINDIEENPMSKVSFNVATLF
jgi:hypothetical protein